MTDLKQSMINELETLGALTFKRDMIIFKSNSIGFRYTKKGTDQEAMLSDILKLARWAHGE